MSRKRNALFKRGAVMVALGALTLTSVSFPANAGESNRSGPKLEVYTVEGPSDKVAKGIEDYTDHEETGHSDEAGSSSKTDVILTKSQRDKLAASGLKVEVKRNGKGQSSTEQAAAQAAAGYQVWRSWDQKGGIRNELTTLAENNKRIAKPEVSPLCGGSLAGHGVGAE